MKKRSPNKKETTKLSRNVTIEDFRDAKQISEEQEKEKKDIYDEQYVKSTFIKAHKETKGNKRLQKSLKARMGRNIMDEKRFEAQLMAADPNYKPKTKLERLQDELDTERAFAEQFGLNENVERPVDTSSEDSENKGTPVKITGIIKRTQLLQEGNTIVDDLEQIGQNINNGDETGGRDTLVTEVYSPETIEQEKWAETPQLEQTDRPPTVMKEDTEDKKKKMKQVQFEIE